MTSLAVALKNLVNREVAVWLNDVQPEHIELRVGDSIYYIPCSAIVAVRPNA